MAECIDKVVHPQCGPQNYTVLCTGTSNSPTYHIKQIQHFYVEISEISNEDKVSVQIFRFFLLLLTSKSSLGLL